MRSLLLVAIAAAVLAVAVAGKKPLWHELQGYTFEQYRVDFKKKYTPKDEGYAMREAIFYKNLKHIQTLNSDSTRLWKAGVNMFTDMSQQEFARFLDVPLGTVRKWERGENRPSGAAQVLLRVIRREPDAVRRALATEAG